MKRFFLLFSICAALLIAECRNVAGQVNFVSKYSSCERADTVQIGRRMFYSLVSVTGFDKKTRQLMKNLNVGRVVYLNMLECSQEDCAALDAEVREAAASGNYIALDSTSLELGKVSMLFYVDNDHIKQMVMYTPPPKTSLIQIGCYANISALSTKKPSEEGETEKKE